MNKQELPLINVKFLLTANNANLDEITKTLQLNPSRKRNRTEWPQVTIDSGLACDLWEISTEQVTSKSVNTECQKMIADLKGKEKNICLLRDKYSMQVHFEVVIHMNNSETPAIFLERETITFLSTLEADIGFDIYAYDEDYEEN